MCQHLGRAFPIFDLIGKPDRNNGKIKEPEDEKQDSAHEKDLHRSDGPGMRGFRQKG
jgi:hypothetical protein